MVCLVEVSISRSLHAEDSRRIEPTCHVVQEMTAMRARKPSPRSRRRAAVARRCASSCRCVARVCAPWTRCSRALLRSPCLPPRALRPKAQPAPSDSVRHRRCRRPWSASRRLPASMTTAERRRRGAGRSRSIRDSSQSFSCFPRANVPRGIFEPRAPLTNGYAVEATDRVHHCQGFRSATPAQPRGDLPRAIRKQKYEIPRGTALGGFDGRALTSAKAKPRG